MNLTVRGCTLCEVARLKNVHLPTVIYVHFSNWASRYGTVPKKPVLFSNKLLIDVMRFHLFNLNQPNAYRDVHKWRKKQFEFKHLSLFIANQ